MNIESCEYNRFHQIIFKVGARISLEALEDSSVIIFGGEIFPEKRYIYWNFVSSCQERLEQAKRDWKDGRFPKTIKENEYIPLPAETIEL